MTEMSPNGLYELSERMLTDTELLSQFDWGRGRHFGQADPDPKDGKANYCMYTMFTGEQVSKCYG